MTRPREDRVQALAHAGDQAAWSTAALSLVLAGRGPADQLRAAAEVLRALGVDIPAEADDAERQRVGAQAAAPLLQTAALLRGRGQLWSGQTDEALVAQGRASARGAALFVQFAVPELEGLADALASPGARMLDVGTGVAALAVAFAELFPALTVVGLDVLPRVLVLAADTIAASNAAARVEVREQDVSVLDDDGVYALGWLPAPFLPEAALRAGACQVARALVPGGWVMVGHGRFAGEPVEDAVTRFKTVAYGGTALDDNEAQQLLTDAGLGDVRTLPTPTGSPAVTVARRPVD